MRDACFAHHEYYDEAYWDAHAEEFGNLFPLHNKCGARFDLVPEWVNPAVVLCAGVASVAVGVLLRFGGDLAGLSRKEPRRRTADLG
ncbi:hypothetical protein AB0F77_29445 [Streptomyces sp. NPDC026672]|uniref:hypothetical protein n=1 Tax=unclassified Streptomyces TaxID=2593676 RepID=UPI0033F5A538